MGQRGTVERLVGPHGGHDRFPSSGSLVSHAAGGWSVSVLVWLPVWVPGGVRAWRPPGRAALTLAPAPSEGLPGASLLPLRGRPLEP